MKPTNNCFFSGYDRSKKLHHLHINKGNRGIQFTSDPFDVYLFTLKPSIKIKDNGSFISSKGKPSTPTIREITSCVQGSRPCSIFFREYPFVRAVHHLKSGVCIQNVAFMVLHRLISLEGVINPVTILMG